MAMVARTNVRKHAIAQTIHVINVGMTATSVWESQKMKNVCLVMMAQLVQCLVMTAQLVQCLVMMAQLSPMIHALLCATNHALTMMLRVGNLAMIA